MTSKFSIKSTLLRGLSSAIFNTSIKISLRRLFCSLLVILLFVSCASDTLLIPEEQAATQILEAIASADASKFDWITQDEALDLGIPEEEFENEESLFYFLGRRDNFLKMATATFLELKMEAEKIGIDWSDYYLDRVEYKKEGKKSNGTDRISGRIFIMSGGQRYAMEFKDVLITKDGKWKFLLLSSLFERVYGDGSYSQDMPMPELKQDGDFEEFITSLAECFKAGAAEEVDKIILEDEVGTKVVAHESMIPSLFIDHMQHSFIEAVRNHTLEYDEKNYALLIDWGFTDKFKLDEEEIWNKSLVYEVKSSEEMDVLSGIYYTYKGKWYLWQMY